MEDLTPPESIRQNPKVDRTVSIYGYMRGIAMNKNCFIHIPGNVAIISILFQLE
jgi:ribosome biogenesis protein BMS1